MEGHVKLLLQAAYFLQNASLETKLYHLTNLPWAKGGWISCVNISKQGSRTTLISTLGSTSLRENISCVFGPKQLINIIPITQSSPDASLLEEFRIPPDIAAMFTLSGFISSAIHGHGRSTADRQFYFVNSRPCEPSKLMKLVNEVYHQFNNHQYPFIILNIEMSRDSVDVNVTPDKRQIFMDHEKLLLATVKATLLKLYENSPCTLPMNKLCLPTSTFLSPPLSSPSSTSSPISTNSPISMGMLNKWRHATDNKRGADSMTCVQQGKQKQMKLDASFTISKHNPNFCDNNMNQSMEQDPSSDVDMEKIQRSNSEEVEHETIPVPSEDNSNLLNQNETKNREDIEGNTLDSDKVIVMSLDSDDEDDNKPNHGRTAEETNENDSNLNNTNSFTDTTLNNGGENTSDIKDSSPITNGVYHLEPKILDDTTHSNVKSSATNETMYDDKSSNNTIQKFSSKLLNGQLVNNNPYKRTFGPSDKPCGTPKSGENFLSRLARFRNDGKSITRINEEKSKDIPVAINSLQNGYDSLSEGKSNACPKSTNDQNIGLVNDTSDVMGEGGCSGMKELSVIVLGGDERLKEDKENSRSPVTMDVDMILSSHEANLQQSPETVEPDTPDETIEVIDDMPRLQGSYRQSTPVTLSLDIIQDQLKARYARRTVQAQDRCVENRFHANIDPSKNKEAESELNRVIKKSMFEEMKIVGQFNLGFIIVKYDSDLFIIDQHATDEKYNFETLQKTTVIKSQKLVVPQNLHLTKINQCILKDNLPVFYKNGFEFSFDLSDDGNVLLTSLPMSKNTTLGREDIEELLFMLQHTNSTEHCRPSRIRAMFASRACRKSVMIGRALSVGEMTGLVRNMGRIDQPWNCPHGRPTMRHLINLSLLVHNHRSHESTPQNQESTHEKSVSVLENTESTHNNSESIPGNSESTHENHESIPEKNESTPQNQEPTHENSESVLESS
ncbi:hypothetical protein M8J75_001113 [Diaphorina citri]|nr:hypothetical protein M8J75_001113 [Diaphorina citri]